MKYFLFPLQVYCFAFTISAMSLIGYSMYKEGSVQPKEVVKKEGVVKYYEKLPEVMVINYKKRWI